MYGRYLGLVWVDGILLNLEIIDQAYSNSTLSISDSRYGEVFMKASIAAKRQDEDFSVKSILIMTMKINVSSRLR